MATERKEMPPPAALPSSGGASSSSAVEEPEPVDLAVPHDASAGKIPTPDEHAFGEGSDWDDDDDGASSVDFEFTFARDAAALPSVSADEIFSGGRILPLYPVFHREHPPAPAAPSVAEEDVADRIPIGQLLIEEDETPAEPLLENPPAQCRKSASTGSSGLRWRLRAMVVGRSQSDGKEKFVFLEEAQPAPPPPVTRKKSPSRNLLKSAKKAAAPAAAGGRGKDAKKEVDMVTERRLPYGKGTKEKAVNGPRRSFLPYRQELLGLFAPVHGLRRTYHPF